MCEFYCQECGYHFKTLKAAEKASFGPDGCPRCGGSDVDVGKQNVGLSDRAEREAERRALGGET